MAFQNHDRLQAASEQELVDAAERADAGNRTALPRFFERLGGASAAADREVHPELAEGVLDALGDARQSLIQAMKLADAIDDRAAHVAVAERVAALDNLRKLLGQRWGRG